MKKFCFLAFFAIFWSSLCAQFPAKYWIEFTDKNNSQYSLSRPEEFLSPRAVSLRVQNSIAIDSLDLPVNEHYVKQILALDTSVRCLATSKWLNGISIYSEREDIENLLMNLPFVKYVEKTLTLHKPEPKPEITYKYPKQGKISHSYRSDLLKNGDFDYGKADLQVRVNNVHWLHRMGFHGENVRLMILDGGFQNVDSIPCFEVLRQNNRLLNARNLVQPDKDPMRRHSHGTMVLSCIASYLPGKLVGTAPMVEVVICQTEDSRSESRAEEDYWVAGVEYADSLGCVLLNSSLGYTVFDDTINQRTYDDMNGKVSRASRAATIAASKGLLICNSAGNEGGSKWKYIGAPADADKILTVGAVSVRGKKAYFSSFGPTADGRLKPDACAVGRMTYVSTPAGIISVADGTSFSSPMLTGMVACLWQAFPQKSNLEIIEAVQHSGSHYAKLGNKMLHEPLNNDGYGYGITDFLHAYNLLLNDLSFDKVVYLNNYSADSEERKIDFLVEGSAEQKSYKKLSVKVTPLSFSVTGEKFSGKTKSVAVKVAKQRNGQILHSLVLPKLQKNSNFQMFEIEFNVDGTIAKRIVGLEVAPEI